MPFEWRDDLSIGVKEIDDQHRELISRTNHLMEAIKDGTGKNEAEGIFAYLEKYVHIHFETEEKFMDSINYPFLGEQKEAHAEFGHIIAGVREKIDSEGMTPSTMILVQNKVCNWIINHVTNLDKKIGRFYKESLK